jgi:hypothetical protein
MFPPMTRVSGPIGYAAAVVAAAAASDDADANAKLVNAHEIVMHAYRGLDVVDTESSFHMTPFHVLHIPV